jgi:hypothetical protein
VVDLAYQYADKTSLQIRKLRKDQWDIIITAILFGLTLNLIADFISSIYDPLVPPITLLFRGIVALLATSITVGIMAYLIIRDFRLECKKEIRTQLVFFFDEETGIPYPVKYYYPADRLAIEFEKSDDKQKKTLSQLVKTAASSLDYAKLVPFLEILTIYELTYSKVPVDGESSSIPFKDRIHLKKPPIGLHFAAYNFKIPGYVDFDYQSSETGGCINLVWKNGYHGRMAIEFKYTQGGHYSLDKELTLSPRDGQRLVLYELISDIVVKTNFSPVRLFLGMGNVEKLINWSNNLTDRLVETADWNHFIQPYEQAERKRTYSIPLFEAH